MAAALLPGPAILEVDSAVEGRDVTSARCTAAEAAVTDPPVTDDAALAGVEVVELAVEAFTAAARRLGASAGDG